MQRRYSDSRKCFFVDGNHFYYILDESNVYCLQYFIPFTRASELHIIDLINLENNLPIECRSDVMYFGSEGITKYHIACPLHFKMKKIQKNENFVYHFSQDCKLMVIYEWIN